MKFTRIASLVVASSMAFSAFAADVTGKWSGKMVMDMAAMEKEMASKMGAMKPEQQKMIKSQMGMAKSMLAAMVFKMELKKDGTYTMTTSGAPGQKGDKAETGKWTLKGNTITVTGSKSGQGPKVLTGTVSGNGKTITFDISKVAKEQATKQGAPKGTNVPSMTMIFTKA